MSLFEKGINFKITLLISLITGLMSFSCFSKEDAGIKEEIKVSDDNTYCEVVFTDKSNLLNWKQKKYQIQLPKSREDKWMIINDDDSFFSDFEFIPAFYIRIFDQNKLAIVSHNVEKGEHTIINFLGNVTFNLGQYMEYQVTLSENPSLIADVQCNQKEKFVSICSYKYAKCQN